MISRNLPPRTVLHTFRVLSAPFTAGPPNGCVPRETIREETEITIYTCDYYGKGAHTYIDGRRRWTDVDGTHPGPWFGAFTDGNPASVAHWLARKPPTAT